MVQFTILLPAIIAASLFRWCFLELPSGDIWEVVFLAWMRLLKGRGEILVYLFFRCWYGCLQLKSIRRFHASGFLLFQASNSPWSCLHALTPHRLRGFFWSFLPVTLWNSRSDVRYSCLHRDQKCCKIIDCRVALRFISRLLSKLGSCISSSSKVGRGSLVIRLP